MTGCFDINIEKESCSNFLMSLLDLKIKQDYEYLTQHKTYLLLPEKYLGFYATFPLFFLKPVISSIDKEKIHKLYSATALHVLYIKIKDDVEDGDMVYELGDFDYCLFKKWSIDLLQELFPQDSIFWKYFTSFDNELKIFANQNSYASFNYSELSSDYFLHMARAKGALAKFPALSVNILANDLTTMDSLFYSIDNFNIGYQFMDDLTDCYEDLAKNRLNSFIFFILSTNSNYTLSINEIDSLIRTNIKNYLALVLSFYRKALDNVKGQGYTDGNVRIFV